MCSVANRWLQSGPFFQNNYKPRSWIISNIRILDSKGTVTLKMQSHGLKCCTQKRSTACCQQCSKCMKHISHRTFKTRDVLYVNFKSARSPVVKSFILKPKFAEKRKMCPHKWSLAQWRKHNEISLVFKLDMWMCYIDQQKTDWFEMNLCAICALRIAILLTFNLFPAKFDWIISI